MFLLVFVDCKGGTAKYVFHLLNFFPSIGHALSHSSTQCSLPKSVTPYASIRFSFCTSPPNLILLTFCLSGSSAARLLCQLDIVSQLAHSSFSFPPLSALSGPLLAPVLPFLSRFSSPYFSPFSVPVHGRPEGVSMGGLLDKPVTQKKTESGDSERMEWVTVAMQGWRPDMEVPREEWEGEGLGAIGMT